MGVDGSEPRIRWTQPESDSYWHEQLPLEWVTTQGAGGAPPGGPGGPGVPPGQGAPGSAQGGRPLATKLWEVPEYKERYRQIYQQLVDKVFIGDSILDRMNALREMIKPWVENELVTMEQFESAMTAEPVDAGTAPGAGGPGGPGGPGGLSVPGLNALVNGRISFLKTTLAESPAPTMSLVADVSSVAWSQTAGSSGASHKVTLTLNGTSLPANNTVFASTESGGSWLTLSPAGSAVPGSFTVSNALKLDAGVYNGTLKVHSPGALNSPLTIPVILTVQ